MDSFLESSPWTVVPTPTCGYDGLTQKVREGGRMRDTSAWWWRSGVNAEGQREVLGMDVGTSEDGCVLAGLPEVVDGPRAQRGRNWLPPMLTRG